ncbi:MULTISPECIES: YciI family protein [Rhizobium/Agrobacterium group]|uniref:YciI family protein n=1 Tax=Rhizobium/Agrobacterium group TaxID=227290 RepID=UPI0023017CA3|nr:MULTISPECIES: YciI family protein [Rhizobium/Agrobacterium group]MDA5634351.1 YciI family protein [Agrobacterium sp. ST15.16.024]MDF1891219.1 YciI family protein [Rhizobium rhizogenes]
MSTGNQTGFYVRFAESDPAAAEQRTAQMDAHKAYLRSEETAPLGFKILASGPMQAESGGSSAALIIAEARCIEDMIAFSAADPFVVHGVYKSVRILHWTPTLSRISGLKPD